MVKKYDYNSNILDAFRLFATLQVFAGHVITHFSMPNPPVQIVYFIRGVPILFALCGFLAAKSLEKHRTKEYMVRRAVRILPAFWVCIIVNTLAILLAYDTKPSLREAVIYGITQFLGFNFYTGDWLRGYGVGTPNGVLWTIGVQIQFFLLAPILHKLLRGKSLRTGTIVIAVFALISILCNYGQSFLPQILFKLVGVTVIPYLYFLVLGMEIWYHRDTVIPVLSKCRWVLLVGYILWKFAEMHLNFPRVLDGVLYNTVTTVLLACVMFGFAFEHKWRVPRDYSYGFYLYHMVFVNLAIQMGFTSLEPVWKGALLVVTIGILTLCSAWLSQRVIENPAARLVEKEG